MNEHRDPTTETFSIEIDGKMERLAYMEAARQHNRMGAAVGAAREMYNAQTAAWGWLLIQMKLALGYGFFGKFLASGGANERTAQRAMKLAEECLVNGKFEPRMVDGVLKTRAAKRKSEQNPTESVNRDVFGSQQEKPVRAVVLDEAEFAKPDPSARAMTDAEILASDINDVELRRLEAEREAEEFGDSEDFEDDEDFAGSADGDEAAGGEAEVCPHNEEVEQDASDESGTRVKNGQHGRAGDANQVPSSPTVTDAPGDRDVAGRIGNGGAGKVIQQVQLTLDDDFALAERMHRAAELVKCGDISDAHRRRLGELLDEMDRAGDGDAGSNVVATG